MEFKYPRVSEILAPYTNIALSQIPKDVLENAAKRGTAIHSLCTAYARGDFIPKIEEEYEPYFNSFVEWYDENVEGLIKSEDRLYDDELRYCGKFDLLVQLYNNPNEVVLIDIKTSTKIYESHVVQLAAYKNLVNLQGPASVRGIVFRGILLQLGKKGKPAKEHSYSNLKPYFNKFLHAISLYNYFIRKEAAE